MPSFQWKTFFGVLVTLNKILFICLTLFLYFFFKSSCDFVYFCCLYVLTNIVSLFCLSYLGLYGVFFINLISLFFFWVSLVSQFDFFFIDNNYFTAVFGKWFYLSNTFKVTCDVFIDNISYSFVLLTTSIALFTYCYAFSYFRQEPYVERLLIYLNLFVISMIIFVSAGNVFFIFFGWELVGLTSFLLINFWTNRVSTLKAAFKAFVFNKISDVMLLFFCIIVFNFLNTAYIPQIICSTNFFLNNSLSFFFFNFNILEILSFFLISAAIIKSAQFGFHIWLPDSMEAPVPASALIHSATLVSAGIYLLLRFNPLLSISLYSLYFLSFIGSFTAFYGGFVASYQTDIKRILAYSTISHCGFLVVSCVFCAPEYTILYLYVHGFFKAASFLCVGNVIRFCLNYQDIRYMGGLYKYLPFECCALFICFLNLAGIPFTFGFFIKHLILSTSDFNCFYINYIIYLNLIAGAITGLFYCSKIFFNVFFDFKKGKKTFYNNYNFLNFISFSSSLEGILHHEKKIFIFSCTSLASTLSIFFLVMTSYFISSFIYLNLTSVYLLNSEFNFNNYSISFFNFFSINLNEFFNFGYFNIIIIFFIFFLVFSVFNKVFFGYINYYNLFTILLFFVFLYFFFLIF